MSVTASTTLETFFAALATRINSQLTAALSGTRVFVVDKLRLQSSIVPSIQIEPMSLQAIGEQSGMNAMVLEYKVHAVVRVEFDLGDRQTKRLLTDGTIGTNPRGAFPLAFAVANGLKGWSMTNESSDAQVFLRVEGGMADDLEGLASAYAQFRTMLRVISDG